MKKDYINKCIVDEYNELQHCMQRCMLVKLLPLWERNRKAVRGPGVGRRPY